MQLARKNTYCFSFKKAQKGGGGTVYYFITRVATTRLRKHYAARTLITRIPVLISTPYKDKGIQNGKLRLG